MTLTDDPRAASRPPVSATTRGPVAGRRPRTGLDLPAQQLSAIARFHRARRMAEESAAAVERTRERQTHVARSMEVLRRQQDALVARAHEQLRGTGRRPYGTVGRRAVLAHRDQELGDTVSRVLQGCGVDVVARLDNGADAIGLVVAEQPDLVLVEDAVALVPGDEVVREVRRSAPDTLVAAQADGDRVAELLDAGATTVFTRRVPPVDIARSLLRLVRA